MKEIRIKTEVQDGVLAVEFSDEHGVAPETFLITWIGCGRLHVISHYDAQRFASQAQLLEKLRGQE